MADQPKSIAEEAIQIVHGARRQDYGTPFENHTRTAAMWSAFLSKKAPGLVLTAEDVCFLNLIQKISRASQSINRDGLVDLIGYTLNIELIQQDRAKLENKNAAS